MPSRAYIKVTKTRTRTRTRSPSKSKTVELGTGSGIKRCPTCGKFMGSGKRG